MILIQLGFCSSSRRNTASLRNASHNFINNYHYYNLRALQLSLILIIYYDNKIIIIIN